MYTIAEDTYEGKANEIGASGLEILHYKIIPGTMSLDSDEVQKMMVDMIVEENADLHGVSTLVLEYVQTNCSFMLLVFYF